MKKTLVSALTAALVVGAASTTFAAANPFSDVPADHWAYDAVTQLAADGVIDGYGDTTFKGDRNITRYEMAQMVAKAMAKSNVGGNDKALIDKLAAEFADELNNLGVRVSKLERNADMVKWNGTAEYTFTNKMHENSTDDHTNNGLFRLEPTAEINSNWHVKARLDANTNFKNDTGAKSDGTDDANVSLRRVWAQGDYKNFQVKLGKFAPIDNDSIFDTTFSGAEVSFGNTVKFTLGAGRNALANSHDNANDTVLAAANSASDAAANYQYVGLDYSKNKLALGVSYHHLNSDAFGKISKANGYVFDYKDDGNTSDEANVWMLKAGYTFSKNVAMSGFYAQNHDASDQKNAYNMQLNYKGAQAENKGTWGAWVAYRSLGQAAALFSTYDATEAGYKGWELGANYTPFKNIVTTFRYGNEKNIATDQKGTVLFGRVNFFF